MPKKMYNDGIVFLSLHIYRRKFKEPITSSSENVPDSQSSAYRLIYYQLFKQNVLSAHIRKNTH